MTIQIWSDDMDELFDDIASVNPKLIEETLFRVKEMLERVMNNKDH
jgi:hypothetical protein